MKVKPHWEDWHGGWVFDADWRDDHQEVEIDSALVDEMEAAEARLLHAQDAVGRALKARGWKGYGPGCE